MSIRRRQVATSLLLLPAARALAQTRLPQPGLKLRLGVLTDMSTGFADWSGRGSLVAATMAAEDFMAERPDTAVEIVGADHQNKADVASSIARRWVGNEGVDAIFDVPNSAAALAVNTIVRDANKVLVVSGSVIDDLTGKVCSPNTVQWTIDSWSLAHGTGTALVKAGGNSWFFVTSDFAGGRSLEAAVSSVVRGAGGTILGTSYAPLGTTDFAANLLEAQASGAKVVGLSMSGADLANAIKQAAQFGVVERGQKLAGLVVFLTDIHALGLETAKGLQFTEAFYWDRTEATRTWSRRFAPRNGGSYPTQVQAGVYAGALHYLHAARQVGHADDGRAVVQAMKAMPTHDPLFGAGTVRPDGRKLHDLYLFEAKGPEEAHSEWDLYQLVQTIPAQDAFRPLAAGQCPLVGPLGTP